MVALDDGAAFLQSFDIGQWACLISGRDETVTELVRWVSVLPVHDNIAQYRISWASTRDDVALYSDWLSVSNYIGRQGIRSGRLKRRRLCGVFSD